MGAEVTAVDSTIKEEIIGWVQYVVCILWESVSLYSGFIANMSALFCRIMANKGTDLLFRDG